MKIYQKPLIKENEEEIIIKEMNFLKSLNHENIIKIEEIYNKENNNIENKESIITKKNNDEIIPIKPDSPERLIRFMVTKNNFSYKSTDENKHKEKQTKKVLMAALKSNRLILFCIIVILQAPVSNMAFTLYREIGEYEKIDVRYLQLVGSLYFIFECLSSFVF